jgi:hypothetical protein
MHTVPVTIFAVISFLFWWLRIKYSTIDWSKLHIAGIDNILKSSEQTLFTTQTSFQTVQHFSYRYIIATSLTDGSYCMGFVVEKFALRQGNNYIFLPWERNNMRKCNVGKM